MKTFSEAKTRQAETEEGAGEATASKRKAVSKRSFIDKNGALVDKIEEATGMRYTLLDPAGNHDFDQQCGEPGNLITMAAIFGLQTKIGNHANSVLNDKDEQGTPADAAAVIKEWLSQPADAFVWAERSTGGVGARIDKDALAGSIVAVAQAAGKLKGDEVDAAYAKYRDKLENDPAYVAAVRKVPAVMQEYNTRVGKPAKTIDDLL